MSNNEKSNEQAVSPETLRKRKSRDRLRKNGFVTKSVTLSPFYQEAVKEILEHTGCEDFQRLVLDMLNAYHKKIQAHKQKHACCGKCGDPFVKGGSCVFEGDSSCQYSRSGQRAREMKP
ncbi:hypothetical protein QMT39_003197 [Vibrio cholerae]|nr:hypothetical protein [Vibrio cholerae]